MKNLFKYAGTSQLGGLLFLTVITHLGLSGTVSSQSKMYQELWGVVDGKQVYLYTLTNGSGMVLKITNYGGIITSILVPDKNGNLEDVVLGFDNLQQYLDGHPCFGATIGRFANRIRNGSFEIAGETYQLDLNDGEHCIHGGNEFDRVVWDSETINDAKDLGIKLHYLSRDGAKGFPGNLDVDVTYTLTKDNSIRVQFEAATDKITHVNMTQHSYFNLTACEEPIYEHLIRIDADQYTEIDQDVVPTGIISSIKNTEKDLTSKIRMGEHIQELNKNGYHFCYVFNKTEDYLSKVIEVMEPKSGRTLEVSTTQPSVQFYTGNHISNELVGKYGIKYGAHMAFCLETQHLPDSPNHSNFPSTLLRPGEKYEEIVVYKFGIIE